MSTNILLIDLSSIAHREFHTSANDPDPNATATKTVAKVRALASGRLSGVAIAMDGPPYFRKDIDPTYKAQRDKENNAVVGHQIATAADTLRADGFPVWQAKGFEADDIVATAVTWALAYNERAGENYTVTIASADKDLEQLVSERVTIHKADGSLCDASTVLAKRGVDPRQMVDYLALVGDASDNIKGCNGIGEKKAAALLAKYGTLEDVFADLDTHGTKFTPATATALREFQGRMETVRSLIRLRTDVLVPFEEVFKERVAQDVAAFGAEEPMEQVSNQAAYDGAVEPTPITLPINPPIIPTDPMRELAKAAEVVNSGAPPKPQPAPQALATRPTVAMDFKLEDGPLTYDQTKTMAIDIFAAKLFPGYGSAPAVLATFMVARELKIPFGVALRGIHIIESRQAFSSDLIRSLCLRSPLCEYFRCTERTPERATWVTKRKDEPEMSLTFTIEEGRAAWQKDDKAWKDSGWGKRPVNMVTKTASSMLARLVYPDVALGMYCGEELTGEEGS